MSRNAARLLPGICPAVRKTTGRLRTEIFINLHKNICFPSKIYVILSNGVFDFD